MVANDYTVYAAGLLSGCVWSAHGSCKGPTHPPFRLLLPWFWSTPSPRCGDRGRKSGLWHGVSASSTALLPTVRRRRGTASESNLPTAERSDGVRRAGG